MTNQSAPEQKLLYSSQEVCHQLGICRSVLHRLTREGQVRSVSIGRSRRYPASALLDYLKTLEASSDARI